MPKRLPGAVAHRASAAGLAPGVPTGHPPQAPRAMTNWWPEPGVAGALWAPATGPGPCPRVHHR
eukprot:6629446-Lingulodinium_polyedra.AAC.1